MLYLRLVVHPRFMATILCQVANYGHSITSKDTQNYYVS